MLDPAFQNQPIPTPPPVAQQTSAHKLRLALLRVIGKSLALRSPAPAKSGKILLIRPDHLGDLLFLTPTLRDLRQQLPHAHISLMIGKWSRAIVENNPNIDEIITCDFPGFTRQPKPSMAQPYVYLRAQAEILHRHQFERAIILRFDHWWGAMLASLAGIPNRVGYATESVAPFLTHSLPYFDNRHEVLQNWQLAYFAASKNSTPHHAPGDLEFFTANDDDIWAKNWLDAQGIKNTRPMVIIHPGAGAKVKLWRDEAWAKLIDSLAASHAGQGVISGSPAEVTLCQSIAAQTSIPVHIAAGETSLGQMAALTAHAALVIGPDTGPVKLAAAMGTPTLNLYGPVDAVKFGPWGESDSHRIITAGLPCQPCNHLDFADDELSAHYCARGISTLAVIKAAREMLG